MATLGFPSNPSTGTVYTLGTKSWVWTGQGWKIDSGSTTFNNLSVSQLTVTTSTNTTGTNSGALIVLGGASIGQDLFVSGKIFAQELDIQYTTITTAIIQTDDIIKTYNSTNAENTISGAINVVGGIGVGRDIYAGGNITANALTLANTTTRSQLYGPISIYNETSSTGVESGALVVTGGVGISGDLYVGNIISNGLQVLTSSESNAGYVSKILAGTDISVSSATGEITVSDISTLQSVTNRGTTTTNAINISNNSESTSSNSGALKVSGGIGVGGDIFSDGKITANSLNVNGPSSVSTITGQLNVGSVIINSKQDAESTNSGALQVVGGIGVGGNIFSVGDIYARGYRVSTGTFTGGVLINNTKITNSETSISTDSGALQVVGGVGIGDNLYVGNSGSFDYITVRGTTTSTVNGELDVGTLIITNSNASIGTDSGALIVSGGAGIGGDIWAGGDIYSKGQQVVTTATINNYANQTTIYAGTDTAVNNNSGAITIWNTSDLQTVTDRGSSTNHAIIITDTSTGALQVVGGVGIGQNLNVGGTVTGNYLQVTGFDYVSTVSGYLDVAVLKVIAPAINYFDAISTDTGAFQVLGGAGIGLNLWVGQNLHVGGTAYLNNAEVLTTQSGLSSILGISVVNQILQITTTTNAYSTDSGALQVVGGVGIGGDTWVGGDIFSRGYQVLTTATINDYANKTSIIAGTDTAISTSTGDITIWNTSNLQTVTDRGNSTTNALLITNITDASSTDSGALQVVGGVGIGGNLYVGGALYQDGQQVLTDANVNQFANQTTIYAGTDTAVSSNTGTNITIWNTSNLQSVTDRGNSTTNTISIHNSLASTGSVFDNALYVEGGVGIGKTLFVTGEALFLNNVTFAGTTTYILTTNTVYTDNIIELHYPNNPGNAWTVDDGKDIGFRFHYHDGVTDQNAGLVLSNDEKYLEWYSNGVEDGTSTFAGGVYGTFKTGNIILANNTASNSTSTGALVVAGGVGIGGNLTVGQQVVTSAITATTDLVIGATGAIEIRNNGHLTKFAASGLIELGGAIVGGPYGANQLDFGASASLSAVRSIGGPNGGVLIRTGTDTSITNTWQFGYDGNLTAPGNIVVQSNAGSTSTNTGALVVTGGVGVGGNLYVGKNANINGSLTLAPVVWSYLPTTFTSIPVTYGATQLTFTLQVDDSITDMKVSQGAGGYGLGSVNLTIPGTTFPGGTTPANDIVFEVETFFSPGPVYSTDVTSAVSYVSGTLPPRYDSIKSTGNVGIGAENSHWTFGTDGVLTLPDAGLITSVSNGILIYPTSGQAAAISNFSGYNQLYAWDSDVSIQTSPNNAGATFNTWVFGTDGKLTNPGDVLVLSATSATSTNSGALQVIGGVGIGGALYVATTSYINNSKILTTVDLETVTYTATFITNDTGTVPGLTSLAGTTSTVYGTYNFGTVSDIWTFNDFNTGTNTGFYSINDASGAPGHIVYIGFENITDFNRIVLNINYTQNSGHTQQIELYNYVQNQWDSFTTYSGSPGWFNFILGTIDSAPYISSGNVTARINHVSSGNTAHRTWIDYVALEKSIQGGQGPRGATGATGAQGIQGLTTTTANTFIFSNTTNSTSTNSGAVTVYGGVGIGGDLYVAGKIVAQELDIQLTTVTTTLLVTDDVISTYNTTEATSTNTGALQVAGGVGIGGSLYVGRGITATSVGVTGNVNIGGNLSVGGTFTATAVSIGGQAVGFGYSGSRGYDGSAITGYTGSASTVQGPQGPQGVQGPQGETGIPGNIGPTGPRGYSGSVGYDGSRGLTGFYGSAGYYGSIGCKGYAGSKGDDGQSVRIVGSTSTADISGFNYVDPTPVLGDGVIITSTGRLWTYTGGTGGGAVAGFIDVGPIVGPQGCRGYSGSVGATGPQGVSGPQGPIGYYGSRGLTGYDGSLGQPGYVGSKGDRGFTGYDGSIGGVGYTGSSGPSGPSGPAGYTGSAASLSSNAQSVAANTSSSTSTNTGALVVWGGLGVGGNVNIGGINWLANPFSFTPTASTSTNTGALTVRGGVGIGGDVWIGGTIYGNGGQALGSNSTGTTSTFTILNTTSSTSTTTGALVVRGGIGVGGDIYIRGQIVDVVSGLAYGVQTTGTTSTFVISNGTNSTSTVTGALVVQGGVGIGQDVNIGGSVQIGNTASAGSISGVSSIVATNITVTGNLIAPGLTFGTGTFITPVVIINKTASTSTNSGALIVSGGVGVGGDVNIGQTLTVGTTATSGSITGVSSINAENIIVTGSLTAPNLNINNSGTFTTPVKVSTTTNATSTGSGALIVTGGAGFGGTVYANSFVTDGGLGSISGVAYITTLYLTATNAISITSNTSATSTTTGALIVTGGAGFGGDLYIGGNIYGATGQSIVASSTGTTSTFTIRNTTLSTSTDSGALIVYGGVGIGGDVYIKGRIVDIASGLAYGVQTTGTTSTYIISNYSQSVSTSTGALTVGGGVGIGGNLYVGGLGTFNTLTVLNTLASTGSVSQNALYVTGGVGIGSTLYVVGPAVFQNSVTFNGTATYILSTNSVYTDNIIELHYPNTSGNTWAVNDNNDIGFRFHYYDTQDRNAFLGRDNATGYLEWVVAAGPDNTTNITGTNGTFRLGSIILTDTTATGSTNTGALQVAGGAGFGGSIYVGSTATIFGTAPAISTGSGALTVRGGVGIGGDLWISGQIYGAGGQLINATSTGTTSTFIISNNATSTSTNSGALQVVGGAGIGGNLNVGGNIVGGGVRSSSTSTAPSSPTVGDIWYNTITDDIYRYTSDGASSYWLDISGPVVTNITAYNATPLVYRLDTALTGNQTTSPQTVFGVGVNLAANTVYQFEAVIALSKSVGATTHITSLLFGGTATLNNISYWLQANGLASTSFTDLTNNASYEYYVQTAAAFATNSTQAAATSIRLWKIHGTVSVNAGGTFIPQYQLSAAPGGAYTTAPGSYIRLTPIGAAGSNVAVGSWS